MLICTLVLLLGAAPASAREKKAPPSEAAVPAAAVHSASAALSTETLSGPELKRLRNSGTAALRKRQAADLEALRLSLKGRPAAEARRAMNELRTSHEKELAALNAGQVEGARGPAAAKGGSAPGEAAEAAGKPAVPGKKP